MSVTLASLDRSVELEKSEERAPFLDRSWRRKVQILIVNDRGRNVDDEPAGPSFAEHLNGDLVPCGEPWVAAACIMAVACQKMHQIGLEKLLGGCLGRLTVRADEASRRDLDDHTPLDEADDPFGVRLHRLVPLDVCQDRAHAVPLKLEKDIVRIGGPGGKGQLDKHVARMIESECQSGAHDRGELGMEVYLHSWNDPHPETRLAGAPIELSDEERN